MTMATSSRPGGARLGGPGSVTVVLANWNGRALLGPCLSAVLAQDYSGRYRVVVVDNGSTDGSVDFLASQFPEVQVLHNVTNNYAVANNLAVRASVSEFVVLLNTDTRVEPRWLTELVHCAARSADIAAVGSLVLLPDGTINSSGITMQPDYSWVDRQLGQPRAAAPAVPLDVRGLSGCAVLYRRSCWQELGGLDEDYHMYYEDVDFSLRCLDRGWRLVLCPSSIVHHDSASALKRAEERSHRRNPNTWSATALKDRLGERNRLFVVARHYPDQLLDLLPQSRFYREADASEVRPALRLVFAKWQVPGLDAEVRNRLADAFSQVRLAQRTVRVENARLIGRERELQQQIAAMRQAYERQISSDAAELVAITEAYERQISSDAAELVAVTEAYERQISSDRAGVATATAAYEGEVAHRERVIGALRELLAQRDGEIERLQQLEAQQSGSPEVVRPAGLDPASEVR